MDSYAGAALMCVMEDHLRYRKPATPLAASNTDSDHPINSALLQAIQSTQAASLP